ncbi:hypothetical protein [Ralstonia sp.]|uniref:hypothetical protein n=1 Tax=Ralstonia sp. TaxID=54061 RepID=UPI0031DD5739
MQIVGNQRRQVIAWLAITILGLLVAQIVPFVVIASLGMLGELSSNWVSPRQLVTELAMLSDAQWTHATSLLNGLAALVNGTWLAWRAIMNPWVRGLCARAGSRMDVGVAHRFPGISLPDSAVFAGLVLGSVLLGWMTLSLLISEDARRESAGTTSALQATPATAPRNGAALLVHNPPSIVSGQADVTSMANGTYVVRFK